MRIHPLKMMKMYQKQRAETIRKAKGFRKQCPNGVVLTLYKWQTEYRHNHIAYCELRGRKYEEIEQKVRSDNKPDRSRINKIKSWWQWAIDDYNTWFKKQREVVVEPEPEPEPVKYQSNLEWNLERLRAAGQ